VTFELDTLSASMQWLVATPSALKSPRGARRVLDDSTAVIDVATASDLALLQPTARAALATTSYGTGELMRAALAAGTERSLLGVGGSATVDSSVGILESLGARCLEADECIAAELPIKPCHKVSRQGAILHACGAPDPGATRLPCAPCSPTRCC
jgi:hypothetical protein